MAEFESVVDYSTKLDNFEGPLDLMLQLIAKNKLNINEIKLTVLIEQYLSHIEKMNLEIEDSHEYHRKPEF
jgi:chromatin segregation and condensation protein Rec8/ScpA/Scc1 (kleisin family)